MSTYTATFRALADYSGAISGGAKLAGSFLNVENAAKRVNKSSLTFGQRLELIRRNVVKGHQEMGRLGKTMSVGVTLPLVVLGAAAVRTFAQFESKIVSAGAKSGATAAQLEHMKKVALDTGNTTKFSATQAATALDGLAAAGFTAEEAIGTLPAVALAAQAANEDLGLTALVTAKAMNAFNIPTAKAGHVADVFTNALNSTALSMQGLQDALGQVGEIGPRFNQTLEDTVAVVGRLVDMGVPAASAGTAVRQALTSLAAPSLQAGKLIQGLGIHLREADGTMRPLPDLVRELQTALKANNPQVKKYQELASLTAQGLKEWAKQNGFTVRQATQMQQAMKNGGKAFSDYALKQLFGVEGAKAFALAMSDGKPVMIDTSTELEKMSRLTQGLSIKLGSKGAALAFIQAHTSAGQFKASAADAVLAVSALGLASDGMSKKIGAAFQKTTAQKIDNLKGSIETLAITLVQKAAPGLNSATDKLTKFIVAASGFAEAHPGMTKFLITLALVVAASGPALLVISKLIGAAKVLGSTFELAGGKVGKGAKAIGIATAALLALQLGLMAAGAIVREFKKNAVVDLESVNKALLDVAKTGDTASLDNLFKFSGIHEEAVNGLTDALTRLAKNSAIDRLNEKAASLLGVSSVFSAIKDQAKGLDDALSTLPLGDAVTGFREIASKAAAANLPVKDLVALFPQYAQTVRDAGRANGYTFKTAEELAAAMRGNLPAGLKMVNGQMVATRLSTDQLGTSLAGAATKEEALATATAQLDLAHNQLKDAENTLATAVQKVVDKFTTLKGGTLDAQEASDNFKKSVMDAATALKGGAGALSDNTTKGLANRDMIRGLVKNLDAASVAAFHHAYETSKAATESGRLKDATAAAAKKLGVGRTALIKLAEKAHLNKKQFKLMIDTMLLTPKQIKTKAEADTKTAKSEVKKLKEEIKKIKDQLAAIQLKFSDNAGKVAANVTKVFQLTKGGPKLSAGAAGMEIPNPPRLAGGGPIRGRGHSKQDNIAGIDRKTGRQSIWVSAKEFVVNALAYKRNKALVEDINAGNVVTETPALAGGGQVATGRQSSQLNYGPAHRTKIKVRGRHNKPRRGMGDLDDKFSKYAGGQSALYTGKWADAVAGIYSKAVAAAKAEAKKRAAAKAAAKAAAAGGGGGPIGKGGYASALGWARQHKGHPYQFGTLFDCSGFISALHSIILGQSPHRRYTTTAFHGPHAAGFTRNKRSPFMVGVRPLAGKSGHMAGTLNGVNVESSGGVGVRVGGSARGAGSGMFSWRGGLARGGVVPSPVGDLPYDLINPKGQRYKPELAELARTLYGDAFGKGGKVRNSGVHLFGEHGPELARTRPGAHITDSKKTLEYLSRIESLAASAPASLAAPGASLLPAPHGLVHMPGGQEAARPITILVDLGDGVTKRIQGVLDEHDEFHASIRRAR